MRNPRWYLYPLGMPTAQRQPEAPQNAAIGGQRYEVLETLGTGGMGVVYRVFDHVTGQQRALKRLHAPAADPQRVAALEREYQTLASLDHPRIIQVYDYGIEEHGPYYTMELLEPTDARDAAPLPLTAACACLRDVATSLALLHARGLIHRDLSPTNIRKASDGRWKLHDFGALTTFGPSSVVVGTPPAIAPEVLAGEPLDQRVDLYALGALAYWLLTGTHAHPARSIADLRSCWARGVQPPSALATEIPAELDALIGALLHPDRLARPTTAAEVISRIEAISELPEEALAETERLAQSFLIRPRFVGRTRERAQLSALLASARSGAGAALCLRADGGMGRSRLLDELALEATLAGALVLRADAGVAQQPSGVARALVLRLGDHAAELVAKLAPAYPRALGRDVLRNTGALQRSDTIEAFLLEASTHKPLVILVDDVEYADPASVGMLAALAAVSGEHPLLLVASERPPAGRTTVLSLTTLHRHCRMLELPELSRAETFELVDSLFGQAPNRERFAEWLHERAAGAPLYALELCRQLVARGTIRYTAGVWTLPVERPSVQLPAALGDAMQLRLAELSEPARALAECLSLQQEPPSSELCKLLCDTSGPTQALALLAELARHDVLVGAPDAMRFSSAALREALLRGMDALRLRDNHRRLGEALAKLTKHTEPALRMQAGWHLIQGDDAVRGADMIADVAADGVTLLQLINDQQRAGAIIEAALSVYARLRYSLYRRAPLLAALAYAGYSEDRQWSERYGDQILDVLEGLTGASSARRLRPWLGRWLSVPAAMLGAYLRYLLMPRAERPYPFWRLYLQLCGAVTSLTGVAITCLDGTRAARIADTLEPFSVLPQWSTFVGVYQFCRSLEQIALENQPTASAMFDTLIARFQDARYYPTLPRNARSMFLRPLYLARGAFAVFKADGRAALECADALDAVDDKLCAMAASQLRHLYHALRGEQAKAAPHRMQVELHAAQFGSAWQVEFWEAPALILLHLSTQNTVEATRLVHRLESVSDAVPSLRRYQRLAAHALMLTRGVPRVVERLAAEYAQLEPRSYIGWAATMGYVARGYNAIRGHAQAKRICEQALSQLTEAHREYVALFLILDLELALADAGLGDTARALERLDAALTRFARCDSPLLQASLHETRARVCWQAGDSAGYTHSLAELEGHVRPTGNPVLIAKYERIARLATRGQPSPDATHSASSSLFPPAEDPPDVETVVETIEPRQV